MKKVIAFIGSLLVGACIGAIGVVLGISLFTDLPLSEFWTKLTTMGSFDILKQIVLSIGFTIVAIVLQIILHEAGHLITGLMTGYRFVSFRIFNLTLIRQNGKFHIKRFGIAGTGGQCILTPPEKPLKEIPTAWYNFGGVAANLITAIIAFILLFVIDEMSATLSLFLVLFGTIGVFLGLLNGIPLKLGGIGNDGYNMRLLLKDDKSKQALLTQLRVNALIQEGVRPKEMPKEWFEIAPVNYGDALQATIRLMGIGHLLDMEEWDAAWEALDEAMNHQNEMIGLLAKETACETIFMALVMGQNERAAQLYTPELSTYVRQYKQVMSSKQRLLWALALYQEKDTAKAKEIYRTVYQQKEQYLMQGEVAMDLALMETLLSKHKS